MSTDKALDAAPVDGMVIGSTGLFFKESDGRRIIRILEALKRLQNVKRFDNNPPFIAWLQSLDGKDLKALRNAIREAGALASRAEVVTLNRAR